MLLQEAINVGLSPLARGTPQKRGLWRKGARFIPAGAGNTVNVDLVALFLAVYPRWRGEHPGLCAIG